MKTQTIVVKRRRRDRGEHAAAKCKKRPRKSESDSDVESDSDRQSDSEYSDTDLLMAVLSDSDDNGEEKSLKVNGKVIRIKHDLMETHGQLGTGTIIWPSAMVVCRYFELAVCSKQKHWTLKGKYILEIGAGVGLTGLACAGMGASVLLTDSQPDVVKILDANIVANKLRKVARASLLDWTDTKFHDLRPTTAPTFDWIVLADVLYPETGAADGLVETLLAHASKHTKIIMAYQHRGCSQCLRFFDKMKAANFKVRELKLPPAVEKALDGRSCHAVQLYQMTKQADGK
jgi:predicted nicotinamide N-methyase